MLAVVVYYKLVQAYNFNDYDLILYSFCNALLSFSKHPYVSALS